MPLLEGDKIVSGRTDAKQAIVRVYSGWAPSEPQLSSRSRTDLQEAAKIDPLAQTRLNALVATEQALDAATRRGDLAAVATITCLLDDPVSTAAPVLVNNSKFEVTLKQRLNGGDCVVVEQFEPQLPEPTRASAVAKSVLLDLGRLRGYFTIGGSTSQGRQQFKQVDTFAGFTVDALIAGKVLDSDYKKNGGGRQLALSTFRRQLNGFIDSRVAVRVASTGNETTPASTGTTPPPAGTPFQRPDQLVFDAEQPAFFELGVHAPMSWNGMDWRNDGKLYSFFFGPIVKWGIQTFSQPIVLRRTVTIDLSKPETDNARFKSVEDPPRKGVEPFWNAGFRVGAYRYELLGQKVRDRQIANDLVSYLDVTWGRAKGYRTYQISRSKNAAGTIETVEITSDVRPRMMLSGRLKLPSLPALVGVDVNVRGFDNDDEPNDFRYILAFRVDAQKALARVFKSDLLDRDR